MILTRKPFTLGSIVQWQVDYSECPKSEPFVVAAEFPLLDGESITSATVTADKTDVTIGTVAVFESRLVTFLLSGGSLNELFTLTVIVNTSSNERYVDTIQFNVVAP